MNCIQGSWILLTQVRCLRAQASPRGSGDKQHGKMQYSLIISFQEQLCNLPLIVGISPLAVRHAGLLHEYMK